MASSRGGAPPPLHPHPRNPHPSTRTRLLPVQFFDQHPVHDGPCNHGTFSPVPTQSPPRGASPQGGSSRQSVRSTGSAGGVGSASGSGVGLMGGKTKILGEEYGVKNPRLTYWMYYIPGLSWMGRYQRDYLLGDIIAGSE